MRTASFLFLLIAVLNVHARDPLLSVRKEDSGKPRYYAYFYCGLCGETCETEVESSFPESTSWTPELFIGGKCCHAWTRIRTGAAERRGLKRSLRGGMLTDP